MVRKDRGVDMATSRRLSYQPLTDITHREGFMNKITRDIMQLLSVDCDTALQVQDIMDCNGVDYSECSTKQFQREVRIAYAELQTA